MTYTPVETIALAIIALAVIKIVILLISPKSWMNFAKSVYSKPRLVEVVSLILAAVIFYYLIQEISVVQILAVTAFVASLMLIGLAKEVGPLIKKYETLVKKGNIWKEYWLYSLIWVVLLAWGIKELFF
jgi:hypothetical protein